MSEEKKQFEKVIEGLGKRFNFYRTSCLESETESAKLGRYDLALKYKEHQVCWIQALNDLQLIESAYQAGKIQTVDPQE